METTQKQAQTSPGPQKRPESNWSPKCPEIIVLLNGALLRRKHYPETGPDRPRAPDEAGILLESEMARNQRSVNKSFINRGH